MSCVKICHKSAIFVSVLVDFSVKCVDLATGQDLIVRQA